MFSVSASEIQVTIGGAPCVITAVDTNDGVVSTWHTVIIAILLQCSCTTYILNYYTLSNVDYMYKSVLHACTLILMSFIVVDLHTATIAIMLRCKYLPFHSI